MREIIIEESRFQNTQQVHAFLKEELGFPDYYGMNFDALADCLGEICEPTQIIVERGGGLDDAWVNTLCVVLAEVAQENSNLLLSVH